ncbi:MAG: PQQ-binding-like beta-propeller repeat protein [Planctomycetes bacterium]|nr:PQQ-binding-like beta-propeller repeat protein [Planctomycetota bacterium]
MSRHRDLNVRGRGCWAGLAMVVLVVAPQALAAEKAGGEAALVQRLVEQTGVSQGVCAVVGGQDGGLALALGKRSQFLVHVWEPEAATAGSVGRMLDEQGLYGRRVIVERGTLNRLPYADNTIDLVLALGLKDDDLGHLAAAEVLRVLRPEGKAVVGRSAGLHGPADKLSRGRLERWLAATKIEPAAVHDEDGDLWAELTKPPMQGVDDWSHWEHRPDNNPVSTDAVITAPYMTQWFGQPYYITMPAITTASAGRLFLAMGHIAHHEREESWLNTLMATNGYNGTVLWTRKLPDGYLAHRSAFVATPDTFYMIDPTGGGCLMLDPKTGEEKDRIRVPEVRGEWKWMALHDGVLFALAGEEKDPAETTVVRSQRPQWSWHELSNGYYTPQVPWGFGRTILAYDVAKCRLLWKHDEDKPIDSRAMVIGGERLVFYGPESRVGCLHLKTGHLRWANDDPKIRRLIEEPGRGLTSTPGFKSACFAIYTPKAVVYEGQTKMNVVAVSLDDGKMLWHHKKSTNNPNMLYLDDRLLVGIGAEGSTLAVDPATGEKIEDLGFKKRSCTRLTATPDSLFCRGWPEGLTRYDRVNKQVVFNGAFRPACNDGMIGTNGLLYGGPWTCDCNLSLMGRIAMCSAGGFDFERRATDEERLELGRGDISQVAPLEASDTDWATYRANADHTASTPAAVASKASKAWEWKAGSAAQITAPTSAGGLIFVGDSNGRVHAIDAAGGTTKWSFLTAGPIMQPPTIASGRAYAGSGDGYIYALEAATGRMLWRFRASPVERRIMVYGSLCSTWPVNTGVLVKDGVAYAAAGIIDYDGTYVYALDAITGRIKWQNVTSGHLDKKLGKGVSAQGNLTIAGGRLWMPGGNVVSPAAYDLRTGEYVGDGPGNGSPRANRGEEIGVLKGRYLVFGGRLRYSARENVVNPERFVSAALRVDGGIGGGVPINGGKIPPAWNDDRIVCVDGRSTVPVCFKTSTLEALASTGDAKKQLDQPVWQAAGFEGSDTVSLALASNGVVAVREQPRPRNRWSQWRVACLNPDDGRPAWEQNLPAPASPGGLLIDRDGRVIVTLNDGNMVCYGG